MKYFANQKTRFSSITPLALLFIFVFTTNLNSLAQPDYKTSIVNGTWTRGYEKTVSLFRIIDGRLEEVANCKLQEDGRFALALPVKEEAFYAYGTGTAIQNVDKYVCYLKPGDVLSVAVNDSSYTLIGENTPENKSIEEWHNFVYPMEQKAFYTFRRKENLSTYVDFYPLLKQKEVERHSLQFETNNPIFNKAFEIYRENDFLCIAVSYNRFPRAAHPGAEDMQGFYTWVDLGKITSTTNLLQHPFGARLVGHLVYQEKKIQQLDEKENFLSLLKNDTLIGEQCIEQLRLIKTYPDFIALDKKVGKYILTDDQKARWEEKKTELAQQVKEGQPAIDFRYPDIKGDTIALSDLKGKVVLIDVWATWCGPCKQQIPFLKKMEEEYSGKDIEFLSVSVDVEKDHQKWIDFVKTEELKGIQLFAAGWESDIIRYYNIKGIPRFIVVGKDGTLVSVDAPRPSHEELKQLIDAELSK